MRILDLGSKGFEVDKVQGMLLNLGYQLNVDGNFGVDTESVVKDFQLKEGLNVDGIVGPNTIERLKLRYDKIKHYYSVNNKDLYSDTPYFVWVDTSQFMVYIFVGSNRNWILIKRFLSTIGKPDTPTPKGTFKMGVKGLGYGGPDYGFRVKWYSQIKGNYLFHSVLFNLDGKTMFDDRLGMALSDGCIRLKEEHAKYIFNHIPSNTTILIT